MSAKVTVVEPSQYLAWVTAQKRLIQQSQKQVLDPAQAIQAAGAAGEDRWRRPSTQPERFSTARARDPRPRRCPSARAGWIDWVTTTDHKKIGILYLFTTAFFFLVGGVEALLMRIQLGTPEQHVPRPDHLQPALHDARHDDDLPGRGPDRRRRSATTSCRS